MVLKKFMSKFGLRNEAQDDDSIAPDGSSCAHRPGPLLRQKYQSIVGIDTSQVLNSDWIQNHDYEDPDPLAMDDKSQRSSQHNPQLPKDAFDRELQAIAELRARRWSRSSQASTVSALGSAAHPPKRNPNEHANKPKLRPGSFAAFAAQHQQSIAKDKSQSSSAARSQPGQRPSLSSDRSFSIREQSTNYIVQTESRLVGGRSVSTVEHKEVQYQERLVPIRRAHKRRRDQVPHSSVAARSPPDTSLGKHGSASRENNLAGSAPSKGKENVSGSRTVSNESVQDWLSAQEELSVVAESEAEVHPDSSVEQDDAEMSRDEERALHIETITNMMWHGEVEATSSMPEWPLVSDDQECVVCGDSKAMHDYPESPPTPRCSHKAQTCTECLQAWMASEIETKGCQGIKCGECPELLDYADVQRASSDHTFSTYDMLTVRSALGNLEDFGWCLNPGCGFGQENIDNSNFMHCKGCDYKQCLHHRIPWHTDETCDAYDYRTSGGQAREDERKTEAMIDSVSKMCPNAGCGLRIEKLDGCDVSV